jgi:hypothetical protein
VLQVIAPHKMPPTELGALGGSLPSPSPLLPVQPTHPTPVADCSPESKHSGHRVCMHMQLTGTTTLCTACRHTYSHTTHRRPPSRSPVHNTQNPVAGPCHPCTCSCCCPPCVLWRQTKRCAVPGSWQPPLCVHPVCVHHDQGIGQCVSSRVCQFKNRDRSSFRPSLSSGVWVSVGKGHSTCFRRQQRQERAAAAGGERGHSRVVRSMNTMLLSELGVQCLYGGLCACCCTQQVP